MTVLFDEPRAPAVAGMFYPGEARKLRAEVQRLLGRASPSRQHVFGAMVPHAGYMYSGALCGRALAAVEIPPSVLILHTKHRPGGGELSLAAYEGWQTPLGVAPTARELTEALAREPLVVSNQPHVKEHAAEVLLPFLQVLRPDVRVAALSVGHAGIDGLVKAADVIAAAVGNLGPALLLASSDMNHYESHAATLAKDERALAPLRAYNWRAMLEVCEREDISMCGAWATALMLEACARLGATSARVLEHTTSGPVSGDFEQVVGYATALVA